MSSPEHLSEDVASLSDEELVARLRSGNLTEEASDIVRRELAARGVDLNHPLSRAADVNVAPKRVAAFIGSRFGDLLGRVLHFPLRAALGIERLWVVVVFGVALNVVLLKLVTYGLMQFLDLRPMPWYPLPIALAATALLALALAWLAVALWTTAGRTQAAVGKSAVRLLAVLVAAYAVIVTLDRIQVMQQYFSSPLNGESVMDSRPK